MNLQSVVVKKISSLASFPPDVKTACFNADHHGWDSSVGVALVLFVSAIKVLEDKHTSEIKLTIFNNPFFNKDLFSDVAKHGYT